MCWYLLVAHSLLVKKIDQKICVFHSTGGHKHTACIFQANPGTDRLHISLGDSLHHLTEAEITLQLET